jgi:hypothetical protein
MSETQIKDGGAGTGRGMTVTTRNRAMVVSEECSVADICCLRGDAYSVPCPLITLTAATESGVFYMLNSNATKYLYLAALRWGYGKSTGGTPGGAVMRFVQNATTGTLISAPTTTIVPGSRNFGSTIPALGTFLSGTEAKTITNGTTISYLISPDNSFNEIPSGIMIPSGSSFSVAITPPPGNTSMVVALTLVIAYIVPSELGSVQN